MLLMVYGTLMNGFHNNKLLEGQKFIEECETKEKYTMYVNGIPYVFPYKETSSIKGELWEVTGEENIHQLDMLEGHPAWYRREEVEIKGLSGKIYKAWLYFLPDESLTLSNMSIIKNGDYRNPEYLQKNKIETINL